MDERTLRTGDLVVDVHSRLHGGILAATVDGTPVLAKDADNRKNDSLRSCIPTGTDLNREYATYLVAKRLPGLVQIPAMAIRNDARAGRVLVMEKIGGDWFQMGGWGAPRGIHLTVARNMALFDAIVGNTDRHSANYFVRREMNGKYSVMAIDHGLCFPEPSLYHGRVDYGQTVFMRGEKLPKWASSWLQRIVAMAADLRRELSPWISQEAIDQMFGRVDWMLRHNSFLPEYRFGRAM